MKYLIMTCLSILITSPSFAGPGDHVDAENPVKVVCMQEQPWKVFVGDYVEFSNGGLIVVQLEGDKQTATYVDSDHCLINANYTVEFVR